MAEETELDSPQAQQFGAPDGFLQILVNMVNNSQETPHMEIGITLLAGGFLVSGNIIHGADYFDGFATDFASPFAGNAEVAESIRSDVASLGDLYRGTPEDAPGLPPPTYIHLKNARFFNTNGNPIPANRGVWWRGRLSEISGFMLGTLSANS